MINLTKDGKTKLDKEYGRRNITDLHIIVKGWKCRQCCPVCRCCQGQIQLETKPGAAGDEVYTVEGYNFSVDPALMAKAVNLNIDAPAGFFDIRPSKPIF